MTKEEVVVEMKKFQESAHGLLNALLQYSTNEVANEYPFDLSFEDVVAGIDNWVAEHNEFSIPNFTKENTGGNCSALVYKVKNNEYIVTKVDESVAPNQYPVQIGLYIYDNLNETAICQNEDEVLAFVKETL